MIRIGSYLIACLSLMVASLAYADGESFSGATMKLRLLQSATSSGLVTSSSETTYGGQTSIMNVGFGYAHTFDHHLSMGGYLAYFNLGAYLDHDFNAADAGSNTQSSSLSSVKLQQVASLTIEPGLVIARNAVLHLKVGYSRARMKLSVNASEDASDSQDTNGWLYGVGAHVQLNRHVYAGVEAVQVDYADATSTLAFSSGDSMLENRHIRQTRAALAVGVSF